MSNETVGQRLDGWRQQMSERLRDGTLSDLEQQCLTQFLQELSNLRPHLVQCYDRESFPRTVPRDGTQYSRPQDALSPHKRAQELEQQFAALWALRGVLRLVGTR